MVIVEPTFHQQQQQYCSKFCCINSPCHSDTAGRCPQKLDLPPILCKPNHSTHWHDIHPFCWFSPKNFSLMPFPVNFRIQEDQLYQEWVYRVWKQHKWCSTAFEFEVYNTSLLPAKTWCMQDSLQQCTCCKWCIQNFCCFLLASC